MLTKKQLSQITQNLQIDSFTIFREYLQLLFLNYLYQEKQAEKIYFKGGTALRLLYNSPRFSEDLDFSTELPGTSIKTLQKKVISKIQKEIPHLKLRFIWQGKKTLRYRIIYQGPEFKYPLTIRMDYSLEKILLGSNIIQINSKIPVHTLSLILGMKEEEILAEKARAFLTRAKGRDLFDFWYLLEREIVLDQKLVQKKLKTVNRTFDKRLLLGKLQQYPLKKLKRDLAKFLPKNYRKIIPVLQEKILEKEDFLN